jgi:hypothetical protein
VAADRLDDRLHLEHPAQASSEPAGRAARGPVGFRCGPAGVTRPIASAIGFRTGIGRLVPSRALRAASEVITPTGGRP